jgi:hypothetical protein
MSDLLNKASLVVIPSGYKEDTVYSVVPSDGSGDLSFTRASNGTRINSAGLVEVCPWNLLLDSNTFNGSGWNRNAVTLTSGQVDKDGGTNAWKVEWTGGSNDSYIFQALPSGQKTGAMWVKGTAGESVLIGIRASVGSGVLFTFNGSWQQFTETSTDIYFVISDFASATATTFFIQNAQANSGSTAKPYFPTTDRLNVPRLTYQNGGGGCPSLLLEKQSTNLALYSEQFDNAVWAKTNITITANDATSPDGTQNADKIVITGGANSINQGTAQITNNTITFSVYAKKGTANIFRIRESFYFGTTVTFDLDNGTITSGTGTITDVGNGWYRCTMTQAYGIGQLNVNWIFDSTSSSGNFYLWGAQAEQSSYPTSYIPTTSSSATRVADACYKTGISSLIGQTEGTLFWDGTLFADNETRRIQMISDNTDNNRILFTLFQNKIEFVGTTSGTSVFSIQSSTITTGRYKIAGAYKANDFVLYVNGVQIGADTSGTVPACNRYDLGQDRTGSLVNTILVNETLISKTRLTNDELISLTTL